MRKHTKRKVWPLVNPILHAIEGAAITPDERLNEVRLRELSAIEAFAKGQATDQEYADLAAMLNLCRTMGGSDGACDAAMLAMNDAQKRFDETGRWGMTGTGLQALRVLYAHHDAQRKEVSRATYEQAISKTVARVRSIGL